MKYFVFVAIFCAALTLAACGGGDSSVDPSSKNGDSRHVRSEEKPMKSEAPNTTNLTEPRIEPPAKLPKKLVVKDLKEGSGPPARLGNKLEIEYLGVDETGDMRFSSWDEPTSFAFTFELGDGRYFPAWDKGLEGMRVGGRRELVFPAKLTHELGPLIYVVDLLKIEKAD